MNMEKSLHDVVVTGQLESCVLLLQRAKILFETPYKLANYLNQVNNHGKRPLFYAAKLGYTKIVELFVTSGASVFVYDTKIVDSPLSALDVAAANEQIETCRYLVSFNPELVNSGVGPLASACATGNTDLVQFFLDNNALVNGLDESPGMYDIPLYKASENGQVVVARLLLKHGADINFGSYGSGTALHAASLHNQHHMIDYLIEQGADITAMDSFGALPQDVGAYEYYVEKGWKMNPLTFYMLLRTRESQGMLSTWLEYDLFFGLDFRKASNYKHGLLSAVTVHQLFQLGPDLDSRDALYGLLTFCIAHSFSEDWFYALLERGNDQRFHTAHLNDYCQQDNPSFFQNCAAGALHRCFYTLFKEDQVESVNRGLLFLKSGNTFDINTLPRGGRVGYRVPTIFEFYRFYDRLKLLLELGSNPNLQDLDGNTALLLCCNVRLQSFSVAKRIRLLLTAGARVDLTNHRMETVWHVLLLSLLPANSTEQNQREDDALEIFEALQAAWQTVGVAMNENLLQFLESMVNELRVRNFVRIAEQIEKLLH